MPERSCNTVSYFLIFLKIIPLYILLWNRIKLILRCPTAIINALSNAINTIVNCHIPIVLVTYINRFIPMNTFTYFHSYISKDRYIF